MPVRLLQTAGLFIFLSFLSSFFPSLTLLSRFRLFAAVFCSALAPGIRRLLRLIRSFHCSHEERETSVV